MSQAAYATRPLSSGRNSFSRPSSSSRYYNNRPASTGSNRRVYLPPLSGAESPRQSSRREQRGRRTNSVSPRRTTEQTPRHSHSSSRASERPATSRGISSPVKTKRRAKTSQSPGRRRTDAEYFDIHSKGTYKTGLERRAMPNHRPPQKYLIWDDFIKMDEDYEDTIRKSLSFFLYLSSFLNCYYIYFFLL